MLLLASHHAETDDTWGLDHGAWTVLKFLYPDADVPVFQLSIDMSRDLDYQLEIGQLLSSLRDRGVLILGSGNVVHNLRAMRPGGQPQDFALEFDTLFADHLAQRDFGTLAGTHGRVGDLSVYRVSYSGNVLSTLSGIHMNSGIDFELYNYLRF